MADIAGTVFTLVSSISSAASRSRVNKTSCFYLSLQCNEVYRRLENGELGPKDDPKLNELVATLGKCRTHLEKFTSYGWLLRLMRNEDIPAIIEEHKKALEKWSAKASPVVPRAVEDVEDLKAEDFEERASKGQLKPEELPTLNPDHLEVGNEVGKFPFGTIHEGSYKGEPVLVRKLSEDIKGSSLVVIRASVRQSRCLVDCPNVLRVLGICQGRMIVTENTTYGPLNQFSLTSTLQKVKIARKVADTIMAFHDVDIGRGKRRVGVILRDIRAANILIDKGKDGEDEIEPRLTGFEMCKRNTDETGSYPDFDEQYRKWWAPEASLVGTYSQSDTYAFGIVMYEISTGKEPTEGDLAEMEDMRICVEYTKLMESCLNRRHHNARPLMEEVVQELLAIELKLMGAEREP